MGDTPQCNNTPDEAQGKFAHLVRPALPVTMGLAIANTCLNVTINESALYLHGALASNGPLFIALAVMAIGMFVLARRNKPLHPLTVRMSVLYSIVLEMATATGLGILGAALTDVNIARFVFVAIMYLASFIGIGYWLRCARGSSAATAAVIVFGAVIISEPLICIAAFLPNSTAYALLVALGFAQALCLYTIQKHPLRPKVLKHPHSTSDDLASPGEVWPTPTGYFSLAETMADDKRLLIMTAVGIWILALAKAVIRVFPAGQPIPYTPTTLAVYFVLTMIVASVLLRLALNENSSIMTVGIWLIMQNFAVLALLACGFFPDHLDIGLSFTYVLDVLLLAYTWYVALAFMSYGRQDAYYYVAGGLIAFLLPRSLTNVAMPFLMGSINYPAATTAIAAALLMLCAQFLFLRLPRLPQVAQQRETRDRPLSHVAARAFGIEEPADTSTAMRLAIMQSYASRMQEQFLLSDRETEVLALYALGYTQDKIAGELFLSPGTVHTYMKRIYGKTNLHSRQELLDYIERYAD